MSMTATATQDSRPTDAGYEHYTVIDRSDKRPIENEYEWPPYPGEGASEIADVAETSTPGRSARGALTMDQRVALRRSLEGLAALEADRADRIVAVGLAPVVAYEVGIRSAVHDALAKLARGVYGECETCARPIPVARLEAVPYARRCLACQEREENGWNRVERVVGGVVRVLAGEPQGRSDAESRPTATLESSIQGCCPSTVPPELDVPDGQPSGRNMSSLASAPDQASGET